MIEKGNSRAREFGISFAEYLRHLIIEDYQRYQQRRRLLTYPIKLPPEIEAEYNRDIEEFERQEKTEPQKGARTGRELINMLNEGN